MRGDSGAEGWMPAEPQRSPLQRQVSSPPFASSNARTPSEKSLSERSFSASTPLSSGRQSGSSSPRTPARGLAAALRSPVRSLLGGSMVSWRIALLMAILVAVFASWRLNLMLHARACRPGGPPTVFSALQFQSSEARQLKAVLKQLQLEEEALAQEVRQLQVKAFRSDWQTPPARQKILAFVGIMSGFNSQHVAGRRSEYRRRRDVLRATWAPGTAEERDRLEREAGIVVRFVAGHSTNPAAETELDEEEWLHGGFLRLPLIEDYFNLTSKTLLYFSTVAGLYDAEYIFKTDDDVFLRLDRIPVIIPHWRQVGADYLGCMKTGKVSAEWWSRWYEPMHRLMSQHYFVHAYGSNYALSGRIAEKIAAMPKGYLRFFSSEDVTVGAWMLALNATHWDEQRICSNSCGKSTLGVWDNGNGKWCPGLCDPIPSLWWLWEQPKCHAPAADLQFYGSWWGDLTPVSAANYKVFITKRDAQWAEEYRQRESWDQWEHTLAHWAE